jgi:hypothetical protein
MFRKLKNMIVKIIKNIIGKTIDHIGVRSNSFNSASYFSSYTLENIINKLEENKENKEIEENFTEIKNNPCN